MHFPDVRIEYREPDGRWEREDIEVIRGTRIPVELLLRKLSEGASESELLEAYPRLVREDIQAAIRYAADTLAHEEVIFLSASQDDPRS